MGRPSPAASARATGCDEQRIATQPSETSAAGRPGRAGSASVSGPGQCAAISGSAAAGTSRHSDASHRPVGHDQRHRLVRRPLLQRPQPLQRRRVQGVDRQAVAGLGRERDDLPARQRRKRRVPGRRRRARVTARGLRRRSPAPWPGGPPARPATRWARPASPSAMICAASSPAFSAPPTATVATGIPGGIITVDSSESKPCRLPEAMGTRSPGGWCARRRRPPGGRRRRRRR